MKTAQIVILLSVLIVWGCNGNIEDSSDLPSTLKGLKRTVAGENWRLEEYKKQIAESIKDIFADHEPLFPDFEIVQIDISHTSLTSVENSGKCLLKYQNRMGLIDFTLLGNPNVGAQVSMESHEIEKVMLDLFPKFVEIKRKEKERLIDLQEAEEEHQRQIAEQAKRDERERVERERAEKERIEKEQQLLIYKKDAENERRKFAVDPSEVGKWNYNNFGLIEGVWLNNEFSLPPIYLGRTLPIGDIIVRIAKDGTVYPITQEYYEDR